MQKILEDHHELNTWSIFDSPNKPQKIQSETMTSEDRHHSKLYQNVGATSPTKR